MEQDQQYVKREEAAQQTAILFERLALLHASYARVIVNELGEEGGRSLIMKAIKKYARTVGEQVREKAQARGEDDSPQNYKGDLPKYGTHDSLETVTVDGEERLRAYGCGMWKTWQALGEEELGRLYCNTDVAKYMGFNPSYKQIHAKALFAGDDCCELVVRPTSEQERADFASRDADWSYLDRDE
ncbi:MAG: L-2-amino-thiazoline-4-carboxylic acid hydrolase [Dehalococcoidia bacterium]|nr:L-2-amino-thiazoline-4-carboxylic acid hydrolase [Dehalococcoidia bacterium]